MLFKIWNKIINIKFFLPIRDNFKQWNKEKTYISNPKKGLLLFKFYRNPFSRYLAERQ